MGTLVQRSACSMFYQALWSSTAVECHPAYTIGLEKQPCMAFRHPARYIFGTVCRELGTWLLWLVGSTWLLIQTVLELYRFPLSCKCCAAGNSW